MDVIEKLTLAELPDFPEGIAVERQDFKNWAWEIEVDDVWVCTPENAAEVVSVVNWAHRNGYRVRAKGASHTWAPLNLFPERDDPERIVYIDMETNFRTVAVNAEASPPQVTAQTGILMDDLCEILENAGLGFTNMPAPGSMTFGGVLAIDGHGGSIPAVGETRAPGGTYGTISNAVLSLTAVVWNADTGAYALRTFQRTEEDCAALLTALGSVIIVEATVQVPKNVRLLCTSHLDIPWETVYAPTAATENSLMWFFEQAGRAESIWFPFTDEPWVKVWEITPRKPLLAREVDAPYNYPASDNIPELLSDLITQILAGASGLTPTFGKTQHAIINTSLTATFAKHIWGWSKNLLHYVRETTLRETANGYAIMTRRDNVQACVHKLGVFYKETLEAFAAEGRYPINGPLEIRVSGLDRPEEVDIPGAVPCALSANRPRNDHPDWDCVIWLDVLTMLKAEGTAEFYARMEQFLYDTFENENSSVRVEWSKGWGYTPESGWVNEEVIARRIPASFNVGQPEQYNWNATMEKLATFDPHGVYRTSFPTTLLQPRSL